MIHRLQLFLGPARFRLLISILGLTGLFSLILNVIVDEAEWARPAQSVLVIIFVIGAAVIIGGKMSREQRLRWLAILAPAFGLVLLGILFFPNLSILFLGAAFGWILAGLFIFTRARGPVEYRLAVKHMRRMEYEQAVKVMDGLIKSEPEQLNHYRFRAELLRLWGKLGRARRDYEKMLEIDPQSAVAYNGIAEIHLQSGEFDSARKAATKALELAPEEWVAAYNLGMIEDRLKLPAEAVASLNRALNAKVPDTRHRLLIYLYLARAYSRQGQQDAAAEMIEKIKKQQSGLDEWQTILGSEQATVLREVLSVDIQTAQELIDGKRDAASLAN